MTICRLTGISRELSGSPVQACALVARGVRHWGRRLLCRAGGRWLQALRDGLPRSNDDFDVY
ncbi:MAG: hypothetical protein KGK15_06990 [Burkholderiales bacterium]|nr:hypothetical protein [Burkholderiales bacterium]MDE2287978.1 hypothetical protein [Burkholderiales bacterium]